MLLQPGNVLRVPDPLATIGYEGCFEQDAEPTVDQIPDGKWGFWWDTVELQMWVCRNRGGTMYIVEMC